MSILIQLTEEQIEKLMPLNELANDAFEKNLPGMILAQIALQDSQVKYKHENALNRGECIVGFISNTRATLLQQIMIAKYLED